MKKVLIVFFIVLAVSFLHGGQTFNMAVVWASSAAALTYVIGAVKEYLQVKKEKKITQKYEPFIKKLKFPSGCFRKKRSMELRRELLSAKEFEMSEIEAWYLKGENYGMIEDVDDILHHYAEKTENCLELCDLIRIQARGVEFFRQNFSEKVLFAWGSVTQCQDECLGILQIGGLWRWMPYLVDKAGELNIGWILVGTVFGSGWKIAPVIFRKVKHQGELPLVNKDIEKSTDSILLPIERG